ncbi:MAG: SDR family oxidoreductase [Rhodobacter sp.]|nr:SDR family oxidoreductase [Rhodobacter sp.]
MKRVLIFGNLGYIGPVLVEALRQRGPVHVTGHDTGYFDRCYSAVHSSGLNVDQQIYGDVRDVDATLFDGVDAVIYLAAISNDPMGRAFAEPTHAINDKAAERVAGAAKAAGVGHFVFASSCSVYGAGGDAAKRETDALDPLTDYAQSKVAAEGRLQALADAGFVVTCLRFATACGPSPRMRLDLVLNDFVATALTEGRITILSDGTPLRPLIDTRDMAEAMIWAAGRPRESGGDALIVNAGSDEWNFSVLDLARQVRAFYGEIAIDVNTEAAPDKRSYRVDFGLFHALAPEAYPTRTVSETIAALDNVLGSAAGGLADFRHGPYIRLNLIRELIAAGVLDKDLRWRV